MCTMYLFSQVKQYLKHKINKSQLSTLLCLYAKVLYGNVTTQDNYYQLHYKLLLLLIFHLVHTVYV